MVSELEAKHLTIVIVGAGAAGYFAAAAIKRNCPNTDVTIVHDPDTPYLGVGESISFNCRDIMKNLFGIQNEYSFDWMKKSNSSYKYSMAYFGFDGTTKPMVAGAQWNPSYNVINQSITQTHKQTISPYQLANGADDHRYTLWDIWLHLFNKSFRKKETRLGDLCESTWYAYYKTMIQNNDHLTTFHFNADYVKEVIHDSVGVPHGVKVKALKIKNVVFDGTKVTHIVGDDDSHIHADLFIDCTGFKRLFSQFVPFQWNATEDTINNTAIVGQGPNRHDRQHPSDTVSRHYAMSNGWVFSLPQPNRSGNGYVYNKNFTSDDQLIVDEFEQRFPWSKNVIKRKISWQTGFIDKPFVANCLSLGVSAGFTDVWDANGFSTQLTFINRLVSFIKQDTQRTFYWQEKYNNFVKNINEDVLKRIQVGIYLAPKNDSPYWQIMNDIGRQMKLKEWLQDAVVSPSRRFVAGSPHFWYQPAWANVALYYNIDIPWQADIDSETEQLAINFFDYFNNHNKIQAKHSQPVNDWYNNFYKDL